AEEWKDRAPVVRTTIGRAMLNAAFPDDFEFRNHSVLKPDVARLVDEVVHRYDRAQVEQVLDELKNLGFHYATRAGVTIGIQDVTTPEAKAAILDEHEKRAQKVEQQYRKRLITDDERRQELIEIWTQATDEVKDAMERQFTVTNSIYMMANSGARGNIMQIRQLAGMRGLVANPKGEIIPRPIKSNFREGLSVLEYFISTHGARKGLADTALRTADSGYLTRRLVDVAQELIVRDEDCESNRGIWVEDVKGDSENLRLLETKLLGRCLAEDVKLADGSKLARNTAIDEPELRQLATDPDVDRVRVRSVLTCESLQGVCSRCYGTMLATGSMVDLGEAIGIIAAQSIGEPGTQLTMRTFHTGGVAGEDITHGLPRVVELFEARKPKGAAVMAESSGLVRIGDSEKGERVITVLGSDDAEEEHVVSRRANVAVRDGQEVAAGE